MNNPIAIYINRFIYIQNTYKTKNKLFKLEHDLDEVINNIKHITDYSILFFERLLKK